MAIFGREMLGRDVLDRTGALLGRLIDLHIDLNTGSVSELLVEVADGIEPSALPFASQGSAVMIPAASVARVAASVHLNR